MVALSNKRDNAKNLHPLQVRAELLRGGHTLASLARDFGVSRQLVSRLLHGGRAGVRGKSGEIYQRLVALAKKARAA